MKRFVIFIVLVRLASALLAQENTKQIYICSELQLIPISDRAFIHITYVNGGNNTKVPSNGLIVINQGKAFLFDTPTNDSVTQMLLDYLKNSLKVQVVGFVTADWHWDSMGGLSVINNRGIPSYANEMTRQIAQSKSLAVPTHGFTDSITIPFGNTNLYCYYFGAAHTMDNIVVWIPSEQILFADCMVKEMKATNLGYTADGNITTYASTLLKVKAKFPTAKMVIPGHGAYGGTELIDHTLKLARGEK